MHHLSTANDYLAFSLWQIGPYLDSTDKESESSLESNEEQTKPLTVPD